MEFTAFKYKSVNFDKLKGYGFVKNGENYVYSTKILDEQFEMSVTVSAVGEVSEKVVDLATDELYTLHLVAEASGAFVGQVRKEFDEVLQDIADKCFERDVFKEDCSHKVIEYVRKTYGDELEFLWEKTPDCAVWRRKDNRKWYGALLIISKRKLGLDDDSMVTVLDLRLDLNQNIVDGKRYFAGYHMNKRTWFTVCMDGSVPADEIYTLIDKSYILAKKK